MIVGFRVSAIGSKDLRQLASRASDSGWTISLTRNNHVRWVAPDGVTSFTTSLTPGSNCALQKARVLIRRFDKLQQPA